MFRVRDLWFRYGTHDVIKGMTLSLEPGKFFSIVGPNGAGKTTLLRLLTGHLKRRKGMIEFLNKAIERYSIEELACYFAVISQGLSIRFPFTCLEIVVMGRNPHVNRFKQLHARDLAIIEDAMQRTDTLRFADSLITEISGGEFQRVMFARALAQQPKVLFLDEAFSGMDLSHRLRSLKLVRQLVEQEGLTTVMILHDLNLAYLFSDEVIVLKEGELCGIGSPQTLMTPKFIHSVFKIKMQRIDGLGLIVVP
ncbi:MAG: ABC transporter ATP-binding protein [Candidatus Vecturithrix sp.]|jgi:iron complex transport system ATP-binding protein|nr:ABC transporter ATP-binding protein [Candidatus Vecturithrix sp.]